MRIVIDQEGQLLLNRAGKLKLQECMRRPDRACGDWCPDFTEPTPKQEAFAVEKSIQLRLCNAVWECHLAEFEDQRL